MFSDLNNQVESVVALALIWIAAVLSVSAFIRKVTKDADKELDVSKRAKLSQTLLSYRKDGIPHNWVPNFNLVFDRFFGGKHLTRRCFYRSSLISAFFYLVLCGLFIPFSFNTSNLEILEIIKLLVGTMLIGLLINIPIDYLSLYETRRVMGFKISTSKKLLLDVFFTVFLTSFWGVVVVLVFGLIIGINMADIIELFFNSLASFIQRDGDEIDKLMFEILVLTPVLTSFSTSIWIWLHGLADVTIRTMPSISIVLSWLDVKEAPIRAIGTVINIVVWMVTIPLLPLVLIFRLI